jgi:hypothetical protein
LRAAEIAAETKKTPAQRPGFLIFSVVDCLIVVAVVIAIAVLLDHDHVVAIAIAAPTTIPIMIPVAALDIHADSDFLGTNRTGNYRERGKEDGQRTATRTL